MVRTKYQKLRFLKGKTEHKNFSKENNFGHRKYNSGDTLYNNRLYLLPTLLNRIFSTSKEKVLGQAKKYFLRHTLNNSGHRNQNNFYTEQNSLNNLHLTDTYPKKHKHFAFYKICLSKYNPTDKHLHNIL